MFESIFLHALQQEIEEKAQAYNRLFHVSLLGPQFFFDRKCRQYPKAAKKRRTRTKWRNQLLKEYGEWF